MSHLTVFIGSSTGNRLEAAVAKWSIQKRSAAELRILEILGDTGQVLEGDTVIAEVGLQDLALSTKFTLMRMACPEICGFNGIAVYLDCDVIALAPIESLVLELPQHASILATKRYAPGSWASSVMVMKNETMKFSSESIGSDLTKSVYEIEDVIYLRRSFLEKHGISVAPINKNWNVFDRADEDTKILHFTNLRTQPYNFTNHPFEDLWFQEARDARRNGALELEFLEACISANKKERFPYRRDLVYQICSDQVICSRSFRNMIHQEYKNVKFQGGFIRYIYNIIC